MNLQQTLTAAIKDIEEYGYDSPERIAAWMAEIRAAAEREMLTPVQMRERMKKILGGQYEAFIRTGYKKSHNIPRFTVETLKPKLRDELDRRILASADLIRLNRQEAMEKTLRRFSGWATSIPAGGSDSVDKTEAKKELKKAIGQLPFAERRVLIDQGHKLISNLNDIVATDSGAIAAVWKSRYRVPGYDYRPDHKERDGKVYAIRGNWALEKGLMKRGPDGYSDEITKPGEEPFCQCSATFLYSLRDLPDDMLTQKGREELARIKQMRIGHAGSQ